MVGHRCAKKNEICKRIQYFELLLKFPKNIHRLNLFFMQQNLLTSRHSLSRVFNILNIVYIDTLGPFFCVWNLQLDRKQIKKNLIFFKVPKIVWAKHNNIVPCHISGGMGNFWKYIHRNLTCSFCGYKFGLKKLRGPFIY